ncbi:AAEL017468-PA [Aedes aegypti]|uniref:AAEL017468-PA n=1 Tax=Aedes aegypti TaxID=7159 RepID=J9HT29_AEDAE|nr:AAEL017468-PA [Aedes aegypti]
MFSSHSKLGRNRVDHSFASAELPGRRQFDHPLLQQTSALPGRPRPRVIPINRLTRFAAAAASANEKQPPSQCKSIDDDAGYLHFIPHSFV